MTKQGHLDCNTKYYFHEPCLSRYEFGHYNIMLTFLVQAKEFFFSKTCLQYSTDTQMGR